MMRHFIIQPTPTFARHTPAVMQAALKLQGYSVAKIARLLDVTQPHIYNAIYSDQHSKRIRDLIERVVRGEVIDWNAEKARKNEGVGRPKSTTTQHRG